MSVENWTAGYMADIGYTFGYYAELNPMRIFSWALTEPVSITAPIKRIARARRSHRFMHLLAFYSVTQGSRRAAQALFICQARLVPV